MAKWSLRGSDYMYTVYSTNPEEKLNKHEVAERSGNVQGSTSVCLAVWSVDVVVFAVR